MSELRGALAAARPALTGVAALSASINVLALTASIYLMLVYDRVLPGRSLPSLFSLLVMVLVAYAFYGMCDVLRSHLLAGIGVRLDRTMSLRIQRIELKLALTRPALLSKSSPLSDLDQIRGFLSGPGPSALIDLPWIVFFLAVLAIIHPWLAIVTAVGVVVLTGLTVVAERITSGRVATLLVAGLDRRRMNDGHRRHVETIEGLGMRERLIARWSGANRRFLAAQLDLSERTATLAGVSKVVRMVLQSAVLTTGALLVIDGKASAGIIFASSILSGRALAPVDQAIGNWRGFVGARQSWARLARLLEDHPAEQPRRVELPFGKHSLTVRRLALVPPESSGLAIADVEFSAKAGDAIGIIGPSASGKSSLLRGICGIWPAVRGDVRIDGAKLTDWDHESLGEMIGYLPQSVELMAGSVADNIARFAPNADSTRTLGAANAAGIHEMILHLPLGYETPVGDNGVHLSAGQRQLIGLARAFYGDPFIVALDEPNSNLDRAGEAALARAILAARARGAIVLVVAHRMSVLDAVNRVLVMQDGRVEASGARDEVLAQTQPRAPEPWPAPSMSAA